MQHSTSELQNCIDHMRAGNDEYRQVLVDYAYERLRLRAHSMLRKYESVHRWEQTDDVLQNASVRLWKALKEVDIEDVDGFFGLAVTQIRRELIDLARHYRSMKNKHATNAGEDDERPHRYDKTDPTSGPLSLSEWAELHEKVQDLPDEEREVFERLYYLGLKQPEAAEVLGISVRTLKRRWSAARRSLYRALEGNAPTDK